MDIDKEWDCASDEGKTLIRDIFLEGYEDRKLDKGYNSNPYVQNNLNDIHDIIWRKGCVAGCVHSGETEIQKVQRNLAIKSISRSNTVFLHDNLNPAYWWQHPREW